MTGACIHIDTIDRGTHQRRRKRRARHIRIGERKKRTSPTRPCEKAYENEVVSSGRLSRSPFLLYLRFLRSPRCASSSSARGGKLKVTLRACVTFNFRHNFLAHSRSAVVFLPLTTREGLNRASRVVKKNTHL